MTTMTLSASLQYAASVVTRSTQRLGTLCQGLLQWQFSCQTATVMTAMLLLWL